MNYNLINYNILSIVPNLVKSKDLTSDFVLGLQLRNLYVSLVSFDTESSIN